jgi:alkylation response protein AidB-like acyl-CoA dehydrogenase
MNFALSDEQELLREAARGALSRVATLEAARAALDGEPLPDLWPTAVSAGWPGLLVSEERGGAGLGVMDALLVFAELGRVLAAAPLLGHLPASWLLDRAGHPAAEAVAAGEQRAAYVPAKPPTAIQPDWTVDPRIGLARAPAPVLAGDVVNGATAWVPDAPGADLLLVACAGGAVAVLRAADVHVEPVTRYDATRSLAHVRFDDAPAERLDSDDQRHSHRGPGSAVADAATAWHIAQALLGAESLGAVERALAVSVAYAKERFTFGRAIGSYQAIKHELVEILRRLENARSLMYYAGWAADDVPAEFPLAAGAFRLVAGEALDHAARTQISVHGGIGATWEHDAPLYFRRAQLARRLLGRSEDAADRVADELFATAGA